MASARTRRTVLKVASIGVAALALPSVPRNDVVASAVVPRARTELSFDRSRLGLPDPSTLLTTALPGVGGEVVLAPGEAQVLLTTFVLRFHYEVRQLLPHDVRSYQSPQQPYSPGLAGHELGIAVDLLPGSFLPGSQETLFPHEQSALGLLKAEFRGVVVQGRCAQSDSLHFRLADDRSRVADASNRVTVGAQRAPGAWPGVSPI